MSSGGIKSQARGGGSDAAGSGELGAQGMMGGGPPMTSWHSMMPTASAPIGMAPWGGDMAGWGGMGMPHMVMPANKHHAGALSGGGGPAGSSLISGQSANTGMQAHGHGGG
jgi:hypothetical protein